MGWGDHLHTKLVSRLVTASQNWDPKWYLVVILAFYGLIKNNVKSHPIANWRNKYCSQLG